MMIEFLWILELLQKVFIFLGYFSPGGSFPKPLNKEEERYLFEKYKNEKNLDAKDKLVHHNLRLVAHVSKKYSSSTIPSEDLISIGIIGLIKAINSFDYTKGIKFATYAARCIDNEILMALRSESKNVSNVFLEDYIGSDDEGNNISFLDILSTDDDVHKKVDIKINSEVLYDLIDTLLEDREKEIIIIRYGLKGQKRYTQREIAKKFGISRSYVSRIEKKAVDKLSSEFRRL